MPATKYRTIPEEVEAFQWDGSLPQATEIIDWVLANGGTARWNDVRRTDTNYNPFTDTTIEQVRRIPAPAHIAIDVPGPGTEKALPDDFIILIANGLFSLTDPVTFLANFEPVPE